jgi:hypothetical protein
MIGRGWEATEETVPQEAMKEGEVREMKGNFRRFVE